PIDLAPRPFTISRVSGDGRSIVFTSVAKSVSDLWIVDDPARKPRRLTLDGNSTAPLWTPDGRRVTYTSQRGGGYSLMSQPADGSALPTPILSGHDPVYAGAWTPDQHTLVYLDMSKRGRERIAAIDVTNGRRTQPVSDQAPLFAEAGGPALSPDGRWLAY